MFELPSFVSFEKLAGFNNEKNKAVFVCSTEHHNQKIHFANGFTKMFISELKDSIDIFPIYQSEKLSFVAVCEPNLLSVKTLNYYGIDAKEFYFQNSVPFEVGDCYKTKSISNYFDDSEIMTIMERHMSNDWGIVNISEKLLNDRGTKNKGIIVSAYMLRGETVLIKTDIGKRITTILLPIDD